MKTRHQTLLTAAAAVALSLSAGIALAESQYGYNSAGTGTVTAQAKVTISVTVPKLILLRVGSANTTVDALNWTAAWGIPAAPVTPSVTANNVNVDWDGTAPTLTTTAPSGTTLTAYAWTNNSGGGNVTFSATAFAAGGPSLSNVTVTNGAGTALAHPAANLGATPTPTTFAAGSIHTRQWTYALGGTPSGWQAGVYSTTVTYTATSL